MKNGIKYLKVKVLIFMVVVTFSFTNASAANTKANVVNCDYVNFRSGAGIKHQPIRWVKCGESVVIVGKSNGWYNVVYNDTFGWIKSEYLKVQSDIMATNQSSNGIKVQKLSAQQPVQLLNKTVYVNASALNVRAGNSTSYGIIGLLCYGEKIAQLENDGNWSKIKTLNGLIGHVSNDYISDTPVNTQGKNVANLALSHVGAPYMWGGQTKKGFDCSGFAKYIYGKVGVNLNRTANDMSDQGVNVSYDNLKAGDLVFFDTDGGRNFINHVGIYVGDGKIVHSSSSAKKVIVTSIKTSYWQNAFMKIQRII